METMLAQSNKVKSSGHLKGLVPSFLEMDPAAKLARMRSVRLDRTIRKRIKKKKAAARTGSTRKRAAPTKKTKLQSLDKIMAGMTETEKEKMRALLVRDLGGVEE